MFVLTRDQHGFPYLDSVATINNLTGQEVDAYLNNYNLPLPVALVGGGVATNRLRKAALRRYIGA